jgi:geranylgeranyl diphosphate synthase type II
MAQDIKPPAVAAECCRTLASAAGVSGLVGGQADDLAGQQEDFDDAEDGQELSRLQSIHRRKTGAIFTAAVRLGGLVAGADDAQMKALHDYADQLGLAFQITDDLLDAAGQQEVTGKRVGKDIMRGKLTYPGLLGQQESRRRASAMIDQACAALSPLGDAAAALEALARFVVERDR